MAEHELRFYGRDRECVYAECEPCQWGTTVEPGHSLADLNRLAAQHSGEVTHQCPGDGQYVMPCCGRTPFEVPAQHRITLDPSLVTCEGKKGD